MGVSFFYLLHILLPCFFIERITRFLGSPLLKKTNIVLKIIEKGVPKLAAKKGITTSGTVPLATQRSNRRKAVRLINKIVVVKTLFATFTGCLLSVGPNGFRVRVYTGSNETFTIITIPINIVIDIFRFPCN